MALFGKTKSGNVSVNFAAVKGTPLEYGDIPAAIAMELSEKRITFTYRVYRKKEPITLEYSQIKRFGKLTETEIMESDKSVIGRAVVGGILLGPLGAVVGAIDGLGTKKKAKERTFFVLNYISSSGQEESLPLEIVNATIGLNKLEERLRELCPNLISDENSSAETSNRL